LALPFQVLPFPIGPLTAPAPFFVPLIYALSFNERMCFVSIFKSNIHFKDKEQKAD
jgi:hypothetical protein